MPAAHSFVSRTSYGKYPRPQVVLICPHDGEGPSFVRYCPQLVEACSCNRETLFKYLNIEQDVGSAALSHVIASSLQARRGDFRVDVVELRMPRGVVDGNRTTETAVQPIFSHAEFPDLCAALRNIHETAVGSVWSVLDQLAPGGVFLDVHSMAPYNPAGDPASPTQAVSKSPTTIPQYVEAYVSPSDCKRPVDIVTMTVSEVTVADDRLAQALAERFKEHGIEYGFNVPYPTDEHIMTTLYMRRYPGNALDVPKDRLVVQQGREAARQLHALTIDPEAVNRLAQPIVEALWQRLQRHGSD